MKKLFLTVALLIGACGVAGVSAGQTNVSAMSQQSVETYNVKAVKNPSASVKIYGFFTVTWDGTDCYVVARDGKYFDRPIRASYSRKYSGYPYCFSYGNQTWYFSL